jgi:hypothetical protein
MGQTRKRNLPALPAQLNDPNEENVSFKYYCMFVEAAASVFEPGQSQDVFSEKLCSGSNAITLRKSHRSHYEDRIQLKTTFLTTYVDIKFSRVLLVGHGLDNSDRVERTPPCCATELKEHTKQTYYRYVMILRHEMAVSLRPWPQQGIAHTHTRSADRRL